MKKLFLFAIILLIAGSACLASPLKGRNGSLGLDSPFFGWLDHDQSGTVISDLGINLGLGVSYRRYFGPVQTNQFNGYWAAGTVALIIPYLGVGADYVWDSGIYFGCGLIWVVPEIHGGIMF
jgi:hypothetical protein